MDSLFTKKVFQLGFLVLESRDVELEYFEGLLRGLITGSRRIISTARALITEATPELV